MKRKMENRDRIEHYKQLPYSILLHEVEDEGEKYWIAEVPELPGCKSHGATVEEAVESLREAKEDWIMDSLRRGEEVPPPVERDRYSGKMLLRMSRSLHRALALMAEAENLSLNQLMVTMLAREVGRLGVLNRVEHKIDSLLDRISDVILEPATGSRRLMRILAQPCEGVQLYEFVSNLDAVVTEASAHPYEVGQHYKFRTGLDIGDLLASPIPALSQGSASTALATGEPGTRRRLDPWELKEQRK